MTDGAKPALEPRLVVKGAAKAIDFYKRALDAKELSRFADPNLDGFIVHAALDIRGTSISLTEESKEWGNYAPTSLDSSPVMMHLSVEDADAVANAMIEAGAEIVIPVADQFYGMREGRLLDPFGHLWIVSQQLEELSDEEIQRRVAEFSKAD